MSKDFKTRPWTVEVSGLVNQPHTYDIDELIKRFPIEERIYRLRCVEAWSMVIPWRGFPLNQVVEGSRTYQRREVRTLRLAALIAEQMPGQQSPFFYGPIAKACASMRPMHDLTLDDHRLVWQRLACRRTARRCAWWCRGSTASRAPRPSSRSNSPPINPKTLWSTSAPNEYGFYSNVNPDVPHPRWSQDSERRIGESSRRPTLMFNGYADQVASLYTGMDLRANY